MDQKERALIEKQIYDQFYDLTSVESATGLTGMTPTMPQNQEELVAYETIMGIPKEQVPQTKT